MRMTKALVAVASGVGLMLTAACGGGSSAASSGSSGGAPGGGTGAATGSATSGSDASGDPVQVGVVTSMSGPLAGYGEQYLAGLKAGLDYVSHGTGVVAGHKITLVTKDAAGDPAKAVSAAKDLVGQGIKILAGPASSGVAVQLAPFAAQNQVLLISGPAATDALTGINPFTYRSGRQTYQDVKTAAAIIGDPKGKSVLVFGQDYEFGQANAKAVNEVLSAEGATVSSLLVPLSATDFTPFAQQIKSKKPDLLFVAWAGDTTAAMWQALDQQGVFDSTTVVTGLADQASFDAYGSATSKITFLSHYFPQAPKNAVNQAMVQSVTKDGGTPDLFTPDGFVAAQLIAHAVEKSGGTDVAAMQKALDGWTFQAPKGTETVRAGDHALIQPMFVAKLVKKGSNYVPQLVKTVPADQVAPPPVAK